MQFVVDIKKVDDDRLLYGEKGAELSTLSYLGINIPEGFIVTTNSYFEFLKENNLQQKVKHLLASHGNDEESLKKVAKHIKSTILESDMPQPVLLQIFRFYRSLGWGDKRVTLAPSPADPHLKLPSSTGIKGEAVVVQDVKNIWASFFDFELLHHRHRLNLSHFKTGIAVVIQRELYAGNSGYVENGQITARKKLTSREEKELLDISKKITDTHFFPKKVHWTISQNKIYITGLSPATGREEVKHEPEVQIAEHEVPETTLPMGRIATGVVKIVENKRDMENIRHGEIVMLSTLKNYDDIKAIRHAKALIIGADIQNQHINLVLTRMGLPVVVDRSAKGRLRNGMVVTVDAARGQAYQGGFKLS